MGDRERDTWIQCCLPSWVIRGWIRIQGVRRRAIGGCSGLWRRKFPPMESTCFMGFCMGQDDARRAHASPKLTTRTCFFFSFKKKKNDNKL